MASSNPVFNNPAFQDARAVQSYPGGAQAANLGRGAGTSDAGTTARLEGMYAAPSAGPVETDRMSVEDTLMKTLGLFGVLAVTAVVGWVWTLGGITPVEGAAINILPWIGGALVGFVLAMVIIFTSRKKVRPGLILTYAAAQGLFVGGISAFFETLPNMSGIVVQAVLATLAVVGVTLALFASGKVRASKRATKIFLIAMVGYLVFSLLNVVLMLFGVFPADQAFGLRSAEIFGIPLGLILGVLVVIMAAYALVLDFDQIQQGVRNGAPRKLAWLSAFGLMVTIVWLYVEILRLIAILRGNN